MVGWVFLGDIVVLVGVKCSWCIGVFTVGGRSLNRFESSRGLNFSA